MDHLIIAAKLKELKHLMDVTPDGQPSEMGESEANFYEYFLDNFDEIVYFLETWGLE